MSDLPAKWVTCDIGETTGYTVMEGGALVSVGQAELWTFVYCLAEPLLERGMDYLVKDPELQDRLRGWELIVLEDWHLYRDKALALVGDKQDTVRGLGACQFIATALGREYHLQGADIKPQAVAAGAEDLFRRPLHPNRHANDSIMHAVNYAGQRGIGVVEAA